MSWNRGGEWTPDWVHSRGQYAVNLPERRLYHFDVGNDFGYKEPDGYVWYRLNCSYWFGDWIEEQDTTTWRSYGGRHRAIYIVREDLMTLIKLKWL